MRPRSSSTLSTIAYQNQKSSSTQKSNNTADFERTFLCPETDFSLKLHIKAGYTSEAQIVYHDRYRVMGTFPIDPTDRTTSGIVSEEMIKKLGDKADTFLTFFSETLLNQVGGKQFILLPKGRTLKGYTKPENSGFTRFRHCTAKVLKEMTNVLLEKYLDFVSMLDEQFYFISNENLLHKKREPKDTYTALSKILDSARFTLDKQKEYQLEDIQGKISRFKNEHVSPFVMLNKANHEIAAIVRLLKMHGDDVNNNLYYLSDEVISQDIISLDFFDGKTDQEKIKQREQFLLAYFMNKVVKFLLLRDEELFLIAPPVREFMYDNLGFANPKLEKYDMLIKLTPPQETLKEMQEFIAKTSIENAFAHKSASSLLRRNSM